MIPRVSKFIQRFRKDECGSAPLIEFALFLPVIFFAFLMAVEMGIYQMRQVQLDRGVASAVRAVRLSTNVAFTHDDVKTIICDNTAWLEDCEDSVKLEMITIDPAAFAGFAPGVDCIDSASADAQPPRGFTLGVENQWMMIRACYRFTPVFPTSGLGRSMEKDGGGKGRMTSTAAFVQEPG